jgi:farnesyl diphosphate synthase
LPPALPPTPAPASRSPYDIALSILIPLGEYFQIQDDFLDYSAPPHLLGKIGTDIIDNKCSWCINTALALASPAQRKTLDENYGRKDAVCEGKVKEVFEELGLRKRYQAYEDEAYARILGLIEGVEEVDGGLKKAVFTTFLNKIYKRSM